MRAKLWWGLAVFLLAAILVVSGAQAGKLLCISQKTLKGEETVSSCLAKGYEFAILDDYGAVRILSKREVELTKAFNPQFFEQRAFSIRYREMAPELKIFGTTVLPSKEK